MAALSSCRYSIAKRCDAATEEMEVNEPSKPVATLYRKFLSGWRIIGREFLVRFPLRILSDSAARG
jgi:hypothetical protein